MQQWEALADKHWKEHRPRMYRHLKQKGVLSQALADADRNARSLVSQRVSLEGKHVDDARDEALSRFVLLPSEDEEPLLTTDQMGYSQLQPIIGSPTPTS